MNRKLILSVSDCGHVKLAALYSGGKDSTFALFNAREMGHHIECLITLHPAADDSALFHYPNSWVTEYLADAMQIPLVEFQSCGNSKEGEVKILEKAIVDVKKKYEIDGVVHGGISSNYQKDAFEQVCLTHGIAPLAPLWSLDPERYYAELLKNNFHILIVGVSAMGLGKEWLGRELDRHTLARLISLSKKYSFNLTFEGGEAETLVIDCPLFLKKLRINESSTLWDGQRGIFEILDVDLVEKK
jgi:diphthine-ammonia ligase